jgi:hypothetical protein
MKTALKGMLLVVILAWASTTPTHVAAQGTCEQACPFENCDYAYAGTQCPGGICGQCIIDWHTWYNNYPCTECAIGEAYYIIGNQWSPPCQYLCVNTTTVRTCFSCVVG